MQDFVSTFGLEAFPHVADIDGEVWARYDVNHPAGLRLHRRRRQRRRPHRSPRRVRSGRATRRARRLLSRGRPAPISLAPSFGTPSFSTPSFSTPSFSTGPQPRIVNEVHTLGGAGPTGSAPDRPTAIRGEEGNGRAGSRHHRPANRHGDPPPRSSVARRDHRPGPSPRGLRPAGGTSWPRCGPTPSTGLATAAGVSVQEQVDAVTGALLAEISIVFTHVRPAPGPGGTDVFDTADTAAAVLSASVLDGCRGSRAPRRRCGTSRNGGTGPAAPTAYTRPRSRFRHGCWQWRPRSSDAPGRCRTQLGGPPPSGRRAARQRARSGARGGHRGCPRIRGALGRSGPRHRARRARAIRASRARLTGRGPHQHRRRRPGRRPAPRCAARHRPPGPAAPSTPRPCRSPDSTTTSTRPSLFSTSAMWARAKSASPPASATTTRTGPASRACSGATGSSGHPTTARPTTPASPRCTGEAYAPRRCGRS